jgi:uncharacterized membrane protein YgaE (UPF0421/DUF939 family)
MQAPHFEALAFSAKAAVSAVVGVLAYRYANLPGSVWVVAVSAVIVTQPTLDSSLQASLLRVVANLAGAVCGAILGLLIGHPLAAMALGIMVMGMACHLLKQDDMLRPAAVAVILVTLAGESGQWDALRNRVLGVAVGCASALVVGFVFDKILGRIKWRIVEEPKKNSPQE